MFLITWVHRPDGLRWTSSRLGLGSRAHLKLPKPTVGRIFEAIGLTIAAYKKAGYSSFRSLSVYLPDCTHIRTHMTDNMISSVLHMNLYKLFYVRAKVLVLQFEG